MGRLVPTLAIAMLVNHQHALASGSRGGFLHQQPQALCLDVPFLPIRLRKKPLASLRTRLLGSFRRLGVREPG